MKRCSVCKETKPLEDFNKSKATKDQHACFCRECGKIKCREWYAANRLRQKNIVLKKLYGITLEKYEKMVIGQGGRCKICCKSRKLYVDHCHETKKVRGLLCNQCNVAIGHLGECISTLNRAIEYVKMEGNVC
jgi:hypothetical protein